MSALDELLTQWRSNPDADRTIALCAFLGTSSREELMREVSASADTWHTDDGRVMLAVGRMHLDAGFLVEAQTALVAAGKASPAQAPPFRYLGEALLRRGDAVRAEKVLARALHFRPDDAETTLWHDRSVVFSALQKRAGVEAVATEVRRTLPKQTSIPPPTVQGLSNRAFAREEPTKPRSQRASVYRSGAARSSADALPRFDSEESMQLSESDLLDDSAPRLSPLASAARANMVSGALSGQQAPSTPFRPLVAVQPSNGKGAHDASRAPSGEPYDALSPDDATDFVIAPGRQFDEIVTTLTPAPFLSQAFPESARGTPARPPLPPPSPLPAPRQQPSTAPALRALSAPTAPALWALSVPPSAAVSPANRGAPSVSRPSAPAPREAAAREASQPDPRWVLEHLARVGVYEPGGGAPPAWETAPRVRRRGTWTLAVAIVLFSAAGVGSFKYSQKIRAERLAHATALNGEVKRLLETGSVSDLKQTDAKLNASFELDSLSAPAARLWLQNRVLYALLAGDDVRGIDSAVHRGADVQLPEKDVAFGKIASFMAEGDLAGGASILSRFDKLCASDAYYQLAAGAVLERAGDLRALERYEAAARLDPDFVPAQVFLARLLLLEFGGERAAPTLSLLRQRLGESAIPRALSALAWVVDSERPEALPIEARLEPSDTEKLPAPLRGIPAMVEAVQAMHSGDMHKASEAIDPAISTAMTPSLATALGFLAIEAGDEALARKAALRALQFAAVYPRARTLAARVALLGGRLDEAQKAIEELEPSSPDVAVVRGVVAYESLEPSDLDGALHSLGEARTHQAYSALSAGPGILTGHAFPTPEKLEAMATPATPWGEIIAADAALDTGNLALAAKLLSQRAADSLRPVHFQRLARLARYQNKPDEALQAAASARKGPVNARLLLESVYDYIQKDDASAARDLLAKHPTLLGPLTAWLSALVDVASKQKAQAGARVAKLDLPPAETPLELRILVARALAASGDKRARPYVFALAKQVPKHPDVNEAALALR